MEVADQATVQAARGQPANGEADVGMGVEDLVRRALQEASDAGVSPIEAGQPAQPEERQQQGMARIPQGDLAAADGNRGARGPERLRAIAILHGDVAKADRRLLPMPILR